MPSRDRDRLHPELKRRLLVFEEAAELQGIPFIVTQTRRTHLEQQAFYAQGRGPLALVNGKRSLAALPEITAEQNEKTITDVKVSVHEYGLGFDVALKGPDGKGVSWDTKADINAAGGPDYDEFLVPVENPKELADCITRILADPDYYQKKIDSLAKLIRSELTIDDQMWGILDVYREVRPDLPWPERK